MVYEKIMTVCMVFMTPENLARITPMVNREGVYVDVHGMERDQALHFVRNVLAAAGRVQGGFLLAVIHGYKHGQRIRNALRAFRNGFPMAILYGTRKRAYDDEHTNGYAIKRQCRIGRVSGFLYDFEENPGVTALVIAPMNAAPTKRKRTKKSRHSAHPLGHLAQDRDAFAPPQKRRSGNGYSICPYGWADAPKCRHMAQIS